MTTLLAGYDGKLEATDALALARLLAEALAAGVIVGTVVDPLPLEMRATDRTPILVEDGERLAAEALASLEGLRSDHVVVVDLDPPGALERIAREHEVDAIVIGSTHRGPLGRILPGAVGERLLADGVRQVAVAPRGYARMAPALSRIAIAFDGSPESREALAAATRLATAAGAELVVASVGDSRDASAAAEIAAPGELGSRAERRLLEGDAATELIDLSRSVDAMYMGSRGRGPVGRVLLGSVSARVMRAAACPVLVTPRPGEPEAPAGSQAEA